MARVTVSLSTRAIAGSDASDALRAEIRRAVEGAVEDDFQVSSLAVGWAGELTDDGRHVVRVRLSGGSACDALHAQGDVEELVRRTVADTIARCAGLMP